MNIYTTLDSVPEGYNCLNFTEEMMAATPHLQHQKLVALQQYSQPSLLVHQPANATVLQQQAPVQQ